MNDLVGNAVHSFLLVPYHGWRISHRAHHGNHGHVENDESWHPATASQLASFADAVRQGTLPPVLSLLARFFNAVDN